MTDLGTALTVIPWVTLPKRDAVFRFTCRETIYSIICYFLTWYRHYRLV
jgi:hypothetical protein